LIEEADYRQASTDSARRHTDSEGEKIKTRTIIIIVITVDTRYKQAGYE
jgi:hypothetical protein